MFSFSVNYFSENFLNKIVFIYYCTVFKKESWISWLWSVNNSLFVSAREWHRSCKANDQMLWRRQKGSHWRKNWWEWITLNLLIALGKHPFCMLFSSTYLMYNYQLLFFLRENNWYCQPLQQGFCIQTWSR